MEDDSKPEAVTTFQRRGGGKSRRYWGRVSRGMNNFRRRRATRRTKQPPAGKEELDEGVSHLESREMKGGHAFRFSRSLMREVVIFRLYRNCTAIALMGTFCCFRSPEF